MSSLESSNKAVLTPSDTRTGLYADRAAREHRAGTPRAQQWASQSWKLPALPMLLFLTVPLAALWLRVSPTDLLSSLHKPAVVQAVGLSMITSFTATGISVLLGTPLAYWLSQNRTGVGRFVDTLVDLPTVMPPPWPVWPC